MSHEQTLAFIARSLVVVNSSRSEGMSQALLEAMTLQVPVLARDIPGNRAIVQDGVTGLLFSDAQVQNACLSTVFYIYIHAEDFFQDFQKKAKLLLKNEALRCKLSDNAKTYVTSQHDYEKERKAYIDILQSLVRQP